MQGGYVLEDAIVTRRRPGECYHCHALIPPGARARRVAELVHLVAGFVAYVVCSSCEDRERYPGSPDTRRRRGKGGAPPVSRSGRDRTFAGRAGR